MSLRNVIHTKLMSSIMLVPWRLEGRSLYASDVFQLSSYPPNTQCCLASYPQDEAFPNKFLEWVAVLYNQLQSAHSVTSALKTWKTYCELWDVLTAVLLNVQFFRDVTLFRWVSRVSGSRRFEVAQCLHFRGSCRPRENLSGLLSFETSGITQWQSVRSQATWMIVENRLISIFTVSEVKKCLLAVWQRNVLFSV
jgi:hypothetical protein